jgi:hypothetical protein
MTETMTYPLRLPRSLKRAVEQWLKSFPLCKRRIFLRTAKHARISRPLTSS